jgi:hypothetical protein
LGHESAEVEEALPEFIHGKHLMRGVAMQKKGLEKKRAKPMKNEQTNQKNNTTIHEFRLARRSDFAKEKLLNIC